MVASRIESTTNMTLLRRRRKRLMTLWCGLAVAALCAFKPQFSVQAATTELVVVNRHTGLAISGFDPVAYFTDGVARQGRADFELSLKGVIWRFANEGNRAAFEADPDIYTPQFGGYDPVAIARGVSTPGHPQVFLLSNRRLYLFYNAEARDAFVSDPDSARRAAEDNWTEVQRTLAP
jgi:hypothetical protein